MKVRQMCGGGTWARSDLRQLRRVDGAVIWDYAGWALVTAPTGWGPFRVRLHGARVRTWLAEQTLGRLAERRRRTTSEACLHYQNGDSCLQVAAELGTMAFGEHHWCQPCRDQAGVL